MIEPSLFLGLLRLGPDDHLARPTMYNNVGLTTPRGSGTSGYIQRNLSALRPRDPLPPRDRDGGYGDRSSSVKHRQPDASILEHEKKRRVENKCVELQLELEEEGKLGEEEIETRVAALREKLLKEGGVARERGSLKQYESPSSLPLVPIHPADEGGQLTNWRR